MYAYQIAVYLNKNDKDKVKIISIGTGEAKYQFNQESPSLGRPGDNFIDN